MIQVSLKPIFHRNAECIGIYFEKNEGIQALIQKNTQARWSRTQCCWYFPLCEKNYHHLAQLLKDKAVLKVDELKTYLLGKKNIPSLPTAVIGKAIVASKISQGKIIIKSNPVKINLKLSKENNEALQKFKQQLVLKSYSQSTIKTYTNEFVQFLHTIKEMPAADFTTTRIKDYLQYCHVTLKLSEATLHSRMNALKFYYEQVLYKEKFFWEIPRPKKPDQLPKVLGENEIGRMFNAV